MTKRYAVMLCAVLFVLAAAPTFATTTCQALNGPGPTGPVTYECIQSGPTASSNFTLYGASQDQMCYLYPPGNLYKSLGAYGSGYGDWSVITPDSPQAYFSIKIILDMNNTHNSSGNRFSVLMYDDDAYTVETLGTIYGSGGDICSQTYTFNVYRPGWEGKHMRLSLQPWFADYDASSKVGYVSFTVANQQTW